MCLVMIANPILYSKTTAAGFQIQLFVINVIISSHVLVVFFFFKNIQ